MAAPPENRRAMWVSGFAARNRPESRFQADPGQSRMQRAGHYAAPESTTPLSLPAAPPRALELNMWGAERWAP
jgi:hypothetical protein